MAASSLARSDSRLSPGPESRDAWTAHCCLHSHPPEPRTTSQDAELAQQIPEVVECHRVTGEGCFILKVHIPAIDQLDRLLDAFLLYGSTTSTIIQSSPVPPRPPPLPEEVPPD